MMTKLITFLTGMAIILIGCAIGSFITAVWFIAGNHVAMVLPVLEKLGIAGLSYFQYWIGNFILSGIISGLFTGVGNKK